MSRSLEARHVVVTGAGGGLGPSVVEALVRLGAVCHTPSRKELDLTDERAVTRYYEALPSLWASVHVAGGFAMAPAAETSLEAFSDMWRINAVTAFLTSREAVRRMRAAGAGGRIVNVATRQIVEPPGGKLAYLTAKSAVAGLTRALAAETEAERILVNAVLPGTIDTPANRAAMPSADRSSWTAPEAIASTIAWLASPDNASVTGALLPV